MKNILELKALSVRCKYNPVLQDINLTLQAGEILGIVGESGSGKSSLLRAIMGILPSGWRISQGELLFGGQDLLRLSEREWRAIRGAQLGMVFQNSATTLCPLRTIGSQIEESMCAHGRNNKQDIYTAATDIFAALNLDDIDRIWRSYPFELSGGMSQRVAIALAAMLEPTVLLADEPTSALDIINQAQILQELQRLQQATDMGIVFVTHNIKLLVGFADRIVVMQQGRVVESGTTQAIINAPQAEYTRTLINAVPRILRS